MGAARYTQEDLELIKDYYGSQNIGWLQCRLIKSNGKYRTKAAIQRKAFSMGCTSYRESRENITVTQLAECMGVHRTQVFKIWIPQGLKVKKSGLTKNRFVEVEPKEWWKFAEINRGKIDFSKYDEGSIIPEPKWVKEELKNPSYKRKYWTAHDVARLKVLKQKGLTYSQIAKELNTTSSAVQKKLTDMYKTGELKRSRVIVVFSDREIDLIKDLYSKGMTYKDIAAEVGRSTSSVTKKMKKLKASK